MARKSNSNILLTRKEEAVPKEGIKKPEEKTKRDLIGDSEFSSKVSKYFLVFFSQLSYPTKRLHPFIPFITLIRSVLISIIVNGFISYPFVQVPMVMMIEISYTVIISLYNNKNDRAEVIVDIFNCAINSLYVTLKFITLFGIDDTMRQKTFGMLMVGVLMIGMTGNFMYVVYSMYMLLKISVKRLVKKCKENSEEKKKRKEIEALYQESTFEYTVPTD